ncbi:DUF423 domain-containing protein [Endozoicomonas numazuensis]|uniref:Membrane protein n=1 Tax=Endozoicomonas numazuensis TaxID=1137799 RepID=A0A081NIP3_9GAMM|nr:DUF423 domain-containing protein [Endozoicomonas numazuensis]KEQ18316.1 membrane protein [Endozoicomonas numazuensis]
MTRFYLLSGALGGLLSVALGAFGAHALKAQLSERYLEVWGTATDYQLYHSLALVLVAVLSILFKDSRKLRWSARLFLTGIILFSGSLYILAITGISWLGAITPLGGVSLMLGWLFLAIFSVTEISD